MTDAARLRDERDLRWIAARCRGESPATIARREGGSARSIKTKTCAIRAADVAESGESTGRVLARYWGRK